jgi:hypothetical protein
MGAEAEGTQPADAEPAPAARAAAPISAAQFLSWKQRKVIFFAPFPQLERSPASCTIIF